MNKHHNKNYIMAGLGYLLLVVLLMVIFKLFL